MLNPQRRAEGRAGLQPGHLSPHNVLCCPVTWTMQIKLLHDEDHVLITHKPPDHILF